MIKLLFNKLGILVDTEIDQVRQGDKGVKLVASFEGKNNANYFARFNLTRPDGSMIKNKVMKPSVTATDYELELDSLWYFEQHGTVTLTVFLVNGDGVQVANGQTTNSVEQTDYSGETQITPDEYEELLEEIAKKLNIKDGILKAPNVTALGNLEQYEIGQLFFIDEDEAIYQLITGYNLYTVFDFTYTKLRVITDVNIVRTQSASNNIITIQLIGYNGFVVASKSLTMPSATTTNAGLMSAEDKATLDNIPDTYETKSHASQTYETKTDHDEDIGDLQSQIDAIVNKSDVVDVVGTYAELEAYDTSKLGDKDIIKVLADETHDNTRGYYRYDKDDDSFNWLGSESPSYTKAESDQIFLTKSSASATYQKKVIYSQTEPENPQENDVWVYHGQDEFEAPLYIHSLSFTDTALTQNKYRLKVITPFASPITDMNTLGALFDDGLIVSANGTIEDDDHNYLPILHIYHLLGTTGVMAVFYDTSIDTVKLTGSGWTDSVHLLGYNLQ